MPLGLFPREVSDATSLMPDEADTSAPPKPGLFAGMGSALASGAEEGAFKLLTALPPMRSQAVLGYNLPESAYQVHEVSDEEYQAQLARDTTAVVQSLAPNPRLVGTAGQMLHGLTSGIVRIVPGAMLAGPVGGAVAVGGSEGVSTTRELEAGGVDANTAAALGAGSALFAGAGALLPGGYGSTLATRIATGSAAMSAFGIANRTMMSQVLTQAGYAEQARAYAPLDGMALLADAVLGAGFGAVHHAFAPDVTDAARVAKDAEHVERAAPGVPVDGASRKAANDAVQAHIDAMIRGDDTPPDVGDVRTVPDPAQEAARAAAMRQVDEAAAEVGAGRVAPPEPPQPAADIVAETRQAVEGERPAGSALSRAGRAAERAKAEGDALAALEPDVREALQQAQAALTARPDMRIGGETEAISARDALRRAIEDIKESSGADELHRVAAACFGRI